jgi:replicative DNA helicase
MIATGFEGIVDYGTLEEMILGQCMKETEEFDRARAMGVEASCFVENTDNGLIWEAMCKVADCGTALDMWNISLELPDTFEYAVKLSSIWTRSPYTQNVSPYVKKLMASRWKAKAIARVNDLQHSLGSAQSLDIDQLTSQISSLSDELPKDAPTDDKPDHFAATIDLAFKDIEEQIIRAQTGGTAGIPTGITGLDTEIYGFQKGSFYIVGGRPGMGKTSLACHFALHSALKGYKTLYMTLEMPQKQIAKKFLSNLSKVNGRVLNTGDMKESEIDRLMHAVRTFHALPLHIDDRAAKKLSTLTGKAKRMKRTKGLDLLVIDYVQQVCDDSQKYTSRQQELTKITSEIKYLALSLDIPIIGLVQLNREADKGSVKLPRLSEIKDSGSIEQDADAVLFIHRESYFDPHKTGESIIVAKNRHGEMNTGVELRVDLATCFFADARDAH